MRIKQNAIEESYKITIYLKDKKKYEIFVDTKEKFKELYALLTSKEPIIQFYNLILNVEDFKLAEVEKIFKKC